MTHRCVERLFNQPVASHMSEVGERLIRSVRKVLILVANQQTLTDETLHSFTCLAENIINSRLPSTLSDGPRDVNPLTPNHLPQPSVTQTMPFGTCNRKFLYVHCCWKHCLYLADLFWPCWRREFCHCFRPGVNG